MNKTLLSLFFAFSSFTHAHAGLDNLTESQVAWSKKQVSVCFAGFDLYPKAQLSDTIPKLTAASISTFSEAQKSVLKLAITGAYKAETSGIEFTGWKDCSESPESDAYVFHVNDNQQNFLGIASIGEAGVLSYIDAPRLFQTSTRKIGYKKGKGKKAYVAINTGFYGEKEALTEDQHLSLTAIHEFGHLAGLRHEHADPAVLVLNEEKVAVSQDLNCKAVGFNSAEGLLDSTEKVSVYDANSIMNYCFLYVIQGLGLNFGLKMEGVGHFLFEDPTIIASAPYQTGMAYKIRIGLSQGDIHALRCMYSYDKATKEKICTPSYNPRTGK